MAKLITKDSKQIASQVGLTLTCPRIIRCGRTFEIELEDQALVSRRWKDDNRNLQMKCPYCEQVFNFTSLKHKNLENIGIALYVCLFIGLFIAAMFGS